MERKKILLVDDEYEMFREFIKHLFGIDVIETYPVKSAQEALEMIKDHPEADIVLLDGRFSYSDDCIAVTAELTKEELDKVVCYSGDPEHYHQKLCPLGVRHFPGKKGDIRKCINDTCGCINR